MTSENRNYTQKFLRLGERFVLAGFPKPLPPLSMHRAPIGYIATETKAKGKQQLTAESNDKGLYSTLQIKSMNCKWEEASKNHTTKHTHVPPAEQHTAMTQKNLKCSEKQPHATSCKANDSDMHKRKGSPNLSSPTSRTAPSVYMILSET